MSTTPHPRPLGRTVSRRVQIGAGLAAVVLLASATAASAHHCYKDDWSAAAHAQHLKGGTPWMPLSDMGVQFLIPPEHQQTCAWVADEAVEDFMASRGMTQEPLIHIKATVGSGAYQKGHEPQPFSYLTEADFQDLTVSLMGHLEECVSG